MGKINCKNSKSEKKEFKVFKNNIFYQIILILDYSNTIKRIKVEISFKLNESFKKYEIYIDQKSEIGKIGNYEQFYDKLISQIKNKKFEIIHQNDNEQFILLKLNIKNESKMLKLIQTISADEITNEHNKMNNNADIIYKNNNLEKNDKNSNNLINTIVNNKNNNEDLHLILNTTSKIWCMLNLNKILEKNKILNLVALGFSNNKIIIINLINMKIYQEIVTTNTVYSLAQFKDDPNYLICSLSNGQMIIYKLKKNKYQQFQILEKPKEIQRGELNKVITLFDGNIATAERGSLSIWKPKKEAKEIEFEFFKEIITDNDTCQLLEVNPHIFACAIYHSKVINVYKNDGNEFPLLGQIDNVESHGSNSNGMVKINDNIFCSGGERCYIYVVSVEPIQVIQKINVRNTEYWDYIRFLHKSYDEFIFASTGEKIIQYKIIKDEDNDFLKLEKFNTIEDGIYNSAIITTEDGKIFYNQRFENSAQSTKLILTKYKQLK